MVRDRSEPISNAAIDVLTASKISWVLIQSSLKNVPKYEVCIYGNGEWYIPANDDVCQESDIVKWCYIND